MKDVFKTELANEIYKTGIIAVLVIDDADDAVPLAKALVAGGITAMELTLRTPVAIEALRRIKAEVPKMMPGVGTVLTIEQVQQAADAGAAFAVAPGMNPRIVKEAVAAGLPFAPGIATPTDIEQALECGCRILKFFPAEPSGGLNYLKSIAAPYAYLGLKYIPLGGIDMLNMKKYLLDPLILALGGSWLSPRNLIQGKNWSAITQNARAAIAMAKEVRKE